MRKVGIEVKDEVVVFARLDGTGILRWNGKRECGNFHFC